MIVSEPPSSMLRAAPKKRLGFCRAFASTPPERTLPDERHDRVVGPRQARDRVEQDHDVALVLDQTLGLLDHDLGHRHVARGGLVEGRADDLALDRALHVRDLLGALVDQQHDQHDLGVVGGDRVGDVLEDHRLAGARRGDDQAALALAERRHHVQHAGGHVVRRGLEVDPALRVERGQVVEDDLVACRVGRLEVDRLDLDQGEVALALAWRTDLAAHGVAGAQVEAANLGRRDVDVVRAREVARFGRAQEPVAVRHHLQDTLREEQAVPLALRLGHAEDEVVLAQPRRVCEAGLERRLRELLDRHLLEAGDLERRGRRGLRLGALGRCRSRREGLRVAARVRDQGSIVSVHVSLLS